MEDRKIDGGLHLALACLYAYYKNHKRYNKDIADIMKLILELDRKVYNDTHNNTCDGQSVSDDNTVADDGRQERTKKD